MKNLLTALLVISVALIPACKKSSTTDSDNNNTSNQREGLELLTDASDTNFCVLILDDYNSSTPDDTIIWESSTKDSTRKGTKTFGNYILNPPRDYACCTREYTPKNSHEKFQSFTVQFRKLVASPSLAGTQPCSVVDSMIKLGEMNFDQDKIVLYIKDQFGLDVSTEGFITPNPEFNIVSITHLATTTGCTKVRVKAKLSDLQFSNFACRVPPYHIKQGLIQMDFTY